MYRYVVCSIIQRRVQDEVAAAITSYISSSSAQLQSITPFIIYQSPSGQHGQFDLAGRWPRVTGPRLSASNAQSGRKVTFGHLCRPLPLPTATCEPGGLKKSNPDVLCREFELG